MDGTSVIQQIENAWQDVPCPETDNIFTPESFDDEGIVNYFGGTTWRGHQVANLRAHSSAFTFFTPIAWRYWLPAFMIGNVDDPAEADVCVESLAWPLTNIDSARRVRLLTDSQRSAVCSYLEFRIERFDDDRASVEQVALERLRQV